MGDSVGLYYHFVITAIDNFFRHIYRPFYRNTRINGNLRIRPEIQIAFHILNVPRLRNHSRIQFLCTVRYLRNPIQPDTRQPRSL